MSERALQEVPFAKQVGENLRRLRWAAGLSPDALAAMAGLRRTQLGLIEDGLRVAPADALWKLAVCLEADLGELLSGLSWCPAAPPVASLGGVGLSRRRLRGAPSGAGLAVFPVRPEAGGVRCFPSGPPDPAGSRTACAGPGYGGPERGWSGGPRAAIVVPAFSEARAAVRTRRQGGATI